MKQTLLVIPLLSFLLLAPAPAQACSCIPKSPTELVEMMDAVFVGVVVSYETVEIPGTAPYNRVEIQASKYWKGELDESRTIFTNEHSASCGVEFERGKEYLVYAQWNDFFDGLYTMLCWRTRLESQADEDLAELGTPDLVPVEPATWGRIKALYSRVK